MYRFTQHQLFCAWFFSIIFGLAIFQFSASANAGVSIIDPFEYATDADARIAWVAQNGSQEVRMADTGVWGAERVMLMPCNTPTQGEARCYYDRLLPASLQDLSQYGQFQLEIYMPDVGIANGVTLYFQSGGGWYTASASVRKGWQTLTFDANAFAKEGMVAGWDNVSTIRLTVWKGNPGVPADIAVRELRALTKNPIAVIANADNKDSLAYAALTSKLLANYDIPHTVISTLNLKEGYLSGVKLAMLPYTPGLTGDDFTALEKHTAGLGKIIAHYDIDLRLQAMLGVNIVGYIADANRFTTINFLENVVPNVFPIVKSVAQASWNIEVAEAIAGSSLNPRVIANWNSGEPAWIASDTGLYMSHVLTDDDQENKSRMLLAMVAHYAPEAPLIAAETAIANIGKVGQHTLYAELVSSIRAKQSSVPAARTPLIEAALNAADTNRNAALDAQARQQTVDAVNLARQARTDLRRAYALAQTAGPVSEFRGIWSDTPTGPFVINDVANGGPKSDWPKSIALLADNGFNAVLANMATGGVAHYANTQPLKLPRSNEFNKYGDQLTALVSAAHAKGVKAHAWIITWYLMGAPATGVTQVSHQLDKNGQQIGIDWLSPCDDANRALQKNVVLEIAKNYEVDGVHLDHIRFPWTDFSYDASCRARFEAERKATVANWPADVATGSLTAEYDLWKPTVITSFVNEVYQELALVNVDKLRRGHPVVKLSAAVFSDAPDAATTVGQDWKTWLDLGIVDALHPMNYGMTLSRFNTSISDQMAVAANRVPVYSGVGIATELNTDGVIDRILATRGENPNTTVTGGFTHYNFNGEVAAGYIAAYGGGITSNRTARVSDLSVFVQGPSSPQNANRSFSYTFSIKNTGSDRADGVVFNEWLSSNTKISSYVPSQGKCTFTGRISCALGSLAVGKTATVKVTVSASSGAVTTNASVFSNATDPQTANNAVAGNAIQINGVPAAPSNLSAIVNSQTQITLSWTDNATDETGFKIERSTNANFDGTITVIQIGRDKRTYANSGLTSGTPYYYRVRAYNGFGASAPSNVVLGTTSP